MKSVSNRRNAINTVWDETSLKENKFQLCAALFALLMITAKSTLSKRLVLRITAILDSLLLIGLFA